MAKWNTTLQAIPGAVRLLVTSAEGDDLVKARLPGYPNHPRALLTLLEGLALWSGETLCAAISADAPVDHSLGLGAFSEDEDRWPEESALVHFVFLVPAGRGRRIAGVGDFRSLRRQPGLRR